MRRSVRILLAIALGLIVVSVAVFRVGLNLSWLDALYFAVTTVTTVGYGDINLMEASAGVKLFGVIIMLAGPAAIASAMALLVDQIVSRRIEQMLGQRQVRMKDHVIVCGLGKVGIRTVESLIDMGQPVVAVTSEEATQRVERARELGATIVSGDMRERGVLERAGVMNCASLIACTADDLANLEAALDARELRPELRVVIRMFNQSLAAKIQRTLGISTALSTSALAGPAFAAAALEPGAAAAKDAAVVATQPLDEGRSLELRMSSKH